MFTIDPRQAAKVAIPDTGQKTLFLDESDSVLKTKDDAGAVEALATADATEPKVYVALLTQTSTNAPTATILKNTLGGIPIWTYSGVGDYVCTLTGVFTTDKTAISCQSTGGAQLGLYFADYGEDMVITSFVVNGDELIITPIVVTDNSLTLVYNGELKILFDAWLLLNPGIEAIMDDTDVENEQAIYINSIIGNLEISLTYDTINDVGFTSGGESLIHGVPLISSLALNNFTLSTFDLYAADFGDGVLTKALIKIEVYP